MERKATDLRTAIADIDSVIYDVHWHETMPDPSLTVLMIEAKAKLMEGRKKLEKVLKVVENSCNQK